MFEIALASHICCHSLEDVHHNVDQKIYNIMQRVENLPKDPYEYGYLKGQLEAYVYVRILLDRPEMWADL